MMVEFELDGQTFTALNGGPEFKFNEAISLQVYCEDQEEIDYYWDKLSRAATPGAAVRLAQGQVRAVLAGRPDAAGRAAGDPRPGKAQRAMEAMLGMKKIDIAKLEEAKAGAGAGAR